MQDQSKSDKLNQEIANYIFAQFDFDKIKKYPIELNSFQKTFSYDIMGFAFMATDCSHLYADVINIRLLARYQDNILYGFVQDLTDNTSTGTAYVKVCGSWKIADIQSLAAFLSAFEKLPAIIDVPKPSNKLGNEMLDFIEKVE